MARHRGRHLDPAAGNHQERPMLIGWVLLIGVCIVVSVLACCVIWPVLLLLAVPYVRSVVLLPISLTYRLYSVEFLAQFGPDFATGPHIDANG